MDHDDHDHHPHGETAEGRVTSPMQAYTAGEAGIGFLVLLIGAAVAFGVPILLT